MWLRTDCITQRSPSGTAASSAFHQCVVHGSLFIQYFGTSVMSK